MPPSSTKKELTSGEIVAIVICSIIGGAALIVLAVTLVKYRRLKHDYTELKVGMLTKI